MKDRIRRKILRQLKSIELALKSMAYTSRRWGKINITNEILLSLIQKQYKLRSKLKRCL